MPSFCRAVVCTAMVHPVARTRWFRRAAVATVRVVETRDRFSVAEIQSVAPGAQVEVKDLVVPK